MDYKETLDKYKLNTESAESPTYWEVELESGYKVYDTKGEKSAWRRLAEYIEQTKDNIVNLTFRLDGKVTTIPKDQQAFFFINKLIGLIGGPSAHQYGIGSSSDKDFKEIKIIWLDPSGHSYPEIRSREKCGLGLIVNP